MNIGEAIFGSTLVICITVLIILCAGEPDLLDRLINVELQKGVCVNYMVGIAVDQDQSDARQYLKKARYSCTQTEVAEGETSEFDSYFDISLLNTSGNNIVEKCYEHLIATDEYYSDATEV